jgi:hypothetical protein
MTVTTVANVQEEFTALDRCDKCGAQARVRARLITGELLFCGHHARETGYKLALQSVEIYDPEGYIQHGDE